MGGGYPILQEAPEERGSALQHGSRCNTPLEIGLEILKGLPAIFISLVSLTFHGWQVMKKFKA